MLLYISSLASVFLDFKHGRSLFSFLFVVWQTWLCGIILKMGNFPYGPRLPAGLIMLWCIFPLPWWEACCCCSDMFIWMSNYNVHSVKLKMVGSVRHDKPSSQCRCLTAWSATASVFWLRGDVQSRKTQRQGQGCCCYCCSALCQRHSVCISSDAHCVHSVNPPFRF